MGVLFSGIVHVSGTHDSGKSVFAEECGAQPEDMAFFDADIKGKDFVDQVIADGHKLGFYTDLVGLTDGMKEVETHNICLAEIAKLEQAVEKSRKGKKFEALIWDTWTPFEITFHPYIVTYPQKFRTYWSPNGTIKGAEQWKASFKYEAEVIDRLLHVAKMVILTSHLKPETVGGRKTGKMIPDCKQPVVEKSMLRAYLMPSSKGPAPIGLILKRIAKSKVTENGMETISVLPRRVEPFTWAEIRRYWQNPIGNRALRAEELPNEFELSILDGTLTDEQKEIMRFSANPVDEEEIVYPQETIEKVRKLNGEGSPKPIIAKACGLSVSDVNKILEM